MVEAKIVVPKEFCANFAQNLKQIKGGMNYLVKQLSAPPDPPRKRIGFGGDASTAKPYGKKRT